eukprot:454254-Prymnesium_polylepis.1
MAQRGGFFIAFYMLYEASTPFLQTLTLPWVKARPTLHALDGTLFTICFLLFRIVTIPHFVYGLYVALPYFRSAPTFTDCPQWCAAARGVRARPPCPVRKRRVRRASSTRAQCG